MGTLVSCGGLGENGDAYADAEGVPITTMHAQGGSSAYTLPTARVRPVLPAPHPLPFSGLGAPAGGCLRSAVPPLRLVRRPLPLASTLPPVRVARGAGSPLRLPDLRPLTTTHAGAVVGNGPRARPPFAP